MSIRLSEKAMLVSLNVSQWTARKKDKRATASIHAQYQAGDDSGQYNKALVAREALDEIRKLTNEAREFHYKMTLPWLDNGTRILPSAHFNDYSQEMRTFKNKFEGATRDFTTNYPQVINDARARLNGLFDPTDYPEPDQINAKFAFDVSVLPMPDAADFRVQLQGEDLQRLQQSTQAQLDAAQTSASRDIYSRLAETVGRMAERLSGEEKKTFRNSLVENIRELVDLIPGLNVTGDQKIEELRQDIKTRLAKYDPDQLRDNAHARTETAQAAQDIMAKMSGYMG